MPFWVLLPGILLLALAINRAYLLRRNYQSAKKLGYPVILSPVASVGPANIVLHNPFVRLAKWLPGHLGDFSRIASIPTWSFLERDGSTGLHAQYGPIFIHCSPSHNELIIADPDIAHLVLARRKEFQRTEFQKVLEIFGPNVDTLDGEDWARHRRLTAPCFNENVSAAVWEESRRQAKAMLEFYTNTAENGLVNSLLDNTRTIALNILSHIGFGMRNDWAPDGASDTTDIVKLEDGYHMSFRDALHKSLSNMIAITILGRNLMESRLATCLGYGDIGCAFQDTGRYIASFLGRERERLAKSQAKEARLNLTSALLKASDEAKKEEGRKTRLSMTDEEIVGNLFIFSVAGHDTTANTLMYAICLLAIFPEWQEWVREEIRNRQLDIYNYKGVYPKLIRVQAIMLESLRLYPQVLTMNKTTGPNSVPLPCTSHILMPKTWVTLNIARLHTNSEFWDPDPLTFRPSRWIIAENDSGGETLMTPRQGTFMPWASGPGICPGMKLAQVEFAAVLSVLMDGASVTPALMPDQDGIDSDGEKARNMLKDALADSAIVEVTLSVNPPKDLWLKWEALS